MVIENFGFWSMFLRGRCFDMVDVSVWLMFPLGRCFDVVDVSMQLMFPHGQCFDVVDVSTWSMFPCDRFFHVVDVSTWLMFRCGWCFDVVDVSTWSMFWRRNIDHIFEGLMGWRNYKFPWLIFSQFLTFWLNMGQLMKYFFGLKLIIFLCKESNHIPVRV